MKQTTIPGLLLLVLWSNRGIAAPTLERYTAELSPEQQTLFLQITEEQFCPCGSPRSFQDTLTAPDACPDAGQLGRFLAAEIRKGLPKKRIVRNLLSRVALLSSRVALNTSGQLPRMGRADSPIQVVVFSDFQCPFCSRVGASLKDLVNQNKDISLVYKYYPLSMHSQAKAAAQAACAANLQGKFWEMHDALFAAQSELGSGDFTAMAKKAGLNLKQYEADRLSVQCAKAVEDDLAEGDRARLQGTPSFYVNGLSVESPEELQSAIDQARLYEADGK